MFPALLRLPLLSVPVAIIGDLVKHQIDFLSGKQMLRSPLALALFILFASGCFRYTPSFKEMNSNADAKVGGQEAFDAYQTNLREKLSQLLETRKHLLAPEAERSYLIGTGDLIKVNVFGFSDLSGDAQVDESGQVSLPLIGNVKAADSNIPKLQVELTKRYKKYVREPKVRVSVEQFNSKKVSVVGAVVRPGLYPLKRTGYLLTELFSEVGGTRENSSGRMYLIPAPTTGMPGDNGSGVEIDLEELVGTLDKPPLVIPLLAGDTVVVPEAGQFRADGEVENPGSFPVTRRTSVLSAVAAAGGFTYAANVNEVELIRDIGAGKKASITVDLEKVAFAGSPDISLRDGDLVVVPSSPARFRARQLVEAFRSILRGGVSGSIKYQ